MFVIPKNELKRKAFHLLTLIYIFGYWYLEKNIVVVGLIIAILIVIVFESLRFNSKKFNDFFKSNFKGFYRPEEARKISGLLGTLLGALIAILIFSNKEMVFASFLYLAFGDSAAALIGKTFGKIKIFSGKTLEGSFACFIVCFITGLFIFSWKFAILGAVIATLIESINWKINDNFWMQIINAGLLTIFSSLIVHYK